MSQTPHASPFDAIRRQDESIQELQRKEQKRLKEGSQSSLFDDQAGQE